MEAVGVLAASVVEVVTVVEVGVEALVASRAEAAVVVKVEATSGGVRCGVLVPVHLLRVRA